MPAGLLIKLGIVLALAAAIGVQSLRLAWSEADLERKAGQLAQAHRDVKDAADANDTLNAANITLQIQARKRADDLIAVNGRVDSLEGQISRLKREARHAPLPKPSPGGDPLPPRLAHFLDGLHLVESAGAPGGDEGGAGGDPARPGAARSLPAAPAAAPARPDGR